MLSPRRRPVALLAIAGIVACSDAGSTSPAELPLATDAPSYTAIPIGNDQVLVKVVTSFRNSTSASVALDRCLSNDSSPIYSVELVSPTNTDGAAYDHAWACVGAAPIVVGPGETRIDTLTLTGPNGFDSRLGRYVGAIEGTFRLDYGGQRSNEFTISLPAEGIVPNVPRDSSAAIQTDSLIVHLAFSAPFYSAVGPMRIAIANPRSDTSFIVNCDAVPSISIEKQVAGAWVSAWRGGVPSCLSRAIAIPPGGQYETSIRLFGGTDGSNVQPQFAVKDVPGVYRFVWSGIFDSISTPYASSGEQIPIEYRRSNPFAIVVLP